MSVSGIMIKLVCVLSSLRNGIPDFAAKISRYHTVSRRGRRIQGFQCEKPFGKNSQPGFKGDFCLPDSSRKAFSFYPQYGIKIRYLRAMNRFCPIRCQGCHPSSSLLCAVPSSIRFSERLRCASKWAFRSMENLFMEKCWNTSTCFSGARGGMPA